MKELLIILVSSAVVHNVVLSQFLGLCPFFGVSKKTETACGNGWSSCFRYHSVFLCNRAYLQFYSCSYRYGILTDNRIYPYYCSTCSVCGNVSQEMYSFSLSGTRRLSATDHYKLCSSRCSAYKRSRIEYNILQGTVNGFATAVGFTISITLMAGIREKIQFNDIPESFKGFPTVLLTAGLMAIAFFGFSGLI